MKIIPKNEVTRVPAAEAQIALEHFETLFSFETDCWDVHSTQVLEERGFVLLDVRSRELFEAGHLPGALHLPHWQIDKARMADFDLATLFVVYCSGPHCNGAKRAAVRLAKLGRPVKEMVGGLEGWRDEGFSLVPV